MDRRSQLMALAVAFVVAIASSPATARAADACLANPAVALRSGKHLYYQTNPETQQKCWFLGPSKTVLKRAASKSPVGIAEQDQAAEQMTAITCSVVPSGQTPRGKRWSYQTDPATGQSCWRLSGRIYRTAKTSPAGPRVPVRLADAGEPSAALPQSIADAQASVREIAPEDVQTKVEDAVAATAAHDAASSASVLSDPATPEDRSIPTFESRWTNDFHTAAADNGRTSRSNTPAIDQPAAAGAGMASFKSAARILATGPPLIDVLVVFVAVLGSVLILLGLLDWSFLLRGSASSAPQHRSPLRLPKLESDSDPMPDQIASTGLVSPLRRDRDEVVSLFAPMADATNVESASHALVKTG